MRKLIITAAFCLSTTPLIAETEEGGSDLMQRGVELFLEGLQQQMAPTLEELQDLAQDLGPELRAALLDMGPALKALLAEVDDWSAYELPERLPNGDIIIRRKPDTPEDPPMQTDL